MNTRDRCLEIKSKVSMHNVLDHYGFKLTKKRMACPIHGGDNKDAFAITTDGRGYNCHTNGCKGDIVSFVKHMESCQLAKALDILEQIGGIIRDEKPRKKSVQKKYSKTPSIKYPYHTAGGDLSFEIFRFEQTNGDGKQCKPYTDGRPGLKDEDRILYNLCDIVSRPDEYVVLVEGEKAADAVSKTGFIGSTNPMGSGQWKDEYGYAETLRDRDVIFIPDADKEGEHLKEAVVASLRGVVRSLRIGKIPDTFVEKYPDIKGHDTADMDEKLGSDNLRLFIDDIIINSPKWVRGVEPGIIVTPREAFDIAQEMILDKDFEVMKFSEWIPGLDVSLYKSDMMVILANTGVGKTRFLHNIPFHFRKKNFLMCDLELSSGMLGLRYASMETGKSISQIIHSVRGGGENPIPDLSHIYLDNTGNIDMKYIVDRIGIIEDIIEDEIHCVAIDYIGLMKKYGASRYGDLSTHAEEFKAFTKESLRVGFVTSQVSRQPGGEEAYFKCPSLFSAKDSGSIENSAQLFMRLWRSDPNNKKYLKCNIGKWSHGDAPEKDFDLEAKNLRIESLGYYDQKNPSKMNAPDDLF